MLNDIFSAKLERPESLLVPILTTFSPPFYKRTFNPLVVRICSNSCVKVIYVLQGTTLVFLISPEFASKSEI